MDKRQLLGVAGSIILAIGVFMPLVTLPIVGSINFFGTGKRDGSILLVLAGGSLVLALTRNYRGLWFTGIGSIGLLAFTFINFQRKMAEISSLSEKDADNPFIKGMSEALSNSIQISFGFPVMVVGAVLMISAAVVNHLIQQKSEA